jgi:hypothetical protein
MGIFPYEIVLGIFQNDDLKFQWGHMNFSRVNDSAEIVQQGH